MFEKKSLTIKDALHGCQPGTVQTVGLMQVVPLLSELEDDRFVSPAEALVSTRDYGVLNFENPTGSVLLVPSHTGYAVKAKVQDHAMAHAALVPARAEQVFETAMCIQQTQGGLIPSGHYRMMILPYALREHALERRSRKSYNKLWDEIGAFNKDFGLQQVGNLVTFLDAYQRQLDEFVAEFECVPRQVGAIVLINGQVVGVERTPSAAYWSSIWDALIRECYGSLAIRTAAQLGETSAVDAWRTPLREDVRSLDDLLDAVEEARQRDDELVREKIRALLDVPFKRKREHTLNELVVETVENAQFVGQIVQEEERICYASLITSRQWGKRRAWQNARPFSI